MYNPYKSIYVPDKELWQRVKEKAERKDIDRSISQIACKLFNMWLDGDIVPYPEIKTDNRKLVSFFPSQSEEVKGK